MQEVLGQIGRQVLIVNLDPANENLTYECHLNIFELITISDVMVNMNLGETSRDATITFFLCYVNYWMYSRTERLAHLLHGVLGEKRRVVDHQSG